MRHHVMSSEQTLNSMTVTRYLGLPPFHITADARISSATRLVQKNILSPFFKIQPIPWSIFVQHSQMVSTSKVKKMLRG